jgi:GST-like protein
MYKLFRSPGCGSTAVEAVLELLDQPYEAITLDWDDKTAWEPLRQWNPLAQVPVLITPQGGVLTESAAILLWLTAQDSGRRLAPAAGSPAQAALFRWMSFLATNVYGLIAVGDFPERFLAGEPVSAAARDSLQAGTKARVQQVWQMMESQLEPAPYLLGGQMTALDVYAAMISRWRPGRAWLQEHCPKLMAAADRTEADPVVKAVWARNFG